MGTGFLIGLGLLWGSALAAVALGRNLTRSIGAGVVFIGLLGLMLLQAGAGFLALVVAILGALMLATIQLFGWMLVDVDRDHLPATDRGTGLARGLAFVIVGLGLALLVGFAVSGGELAPATERMPLGEPMDIGRLLFGPLREITWLVGFAIAAGLLASLLLLRDDGRAR